MPPKFRFRQWNMPRVIYTAVHDGGSDVLVSWEDTKWTEAGFTLYDVSVVEDFLASSVWVIVD